VYDKALMLTYEHSDNPKETHFQAPKFYIFPDQLQAGFFFAHGDATAISYLVVLLLGMSNAAKLLLTS
jgi:hypothetical protein